jgi:hypothetical protein
MLHLVLAAAASDPAIGWLAPATVESRASVAQAPFHLTWKFLRLIKNASTNSS